MNSLPNELLFMIYEYLSFEDLLRCRLVCKHAKSICDLIKIEKLRIGDSSSQWLNPMKIANGNRIQNPLVLKSSFNLKYLKYLVIGFDKWDNFKIEDLNKFVFLEELEIRYLKTLKGMKLSLPNLKKLFLRNRKAGLLLETPKLEAIICGKIDRIKFVYPESLKLLEINFQSYRFEQFKNVEIFIHLQSPQNLTADILEQMPKLKVLYFPFSFFRSRDRTLRPEEAVRRIIKSKVALGRDDLKIYYKGWCLENGEADLDDENRGHARNLSDNRWLMNHDFFKMDLFFHREYFFGSN